MSGGQHCRPWNRLGRLAPTSVLTGAPSVSATGAGFSGSADPNGLPTTAVFQYGLDPKYSRRRSRRVHQLDAGAKRWI